MSLSRIKVNYTFLRGCAKTPLLYSGQLRTRYGLIGFAFLLGYLKLTVPRPVRNPYSCNNAIHNHKFWCRCPGCLFLEPRLEILTLTNLSPASTIIEVHRNSPLIYIWLLC